MATDPYFGDTDQPWEPQDAESQLLASLLRSTRLTLLYGPPRSGKSSLLHGGLMPLLRRRHSDATGVPPASVGNVVSWSDRRRARAGRQRETALLFDTWGEHAAARLKSRMQDSLSVPIAARPLPAPALKALLQQLHDASGTRFLIVFDAFEYCLDPPPGLRAAATAFIDEVLDVIEDARVPAHFLLAVRDDAEPLLARFRARIRGFDNHFLRLPPRQPSADGAEPSERKPTQAEAPVAPELAALPGLPGLPPRDPMVTAAVYESIAAALAAFAPREEPPTVPELRITVVDPAAVPAPAPSQRPPRRPPQQPVPPAQRAARTPPMALPPALWRHYRLASLGVVLSCVVALVGWVGVSQHIEAARAQAAAADTPLPAPAGGPVAPRGVPASAQSSIAIVSSEASDGTTAEATAELARWVAPAASIELLPQPAAGWADALASLHEPGRLAIVRYDALQAARARPVAGAPPLRVVTPLFREALQLLVRADSPLQFIHQIKGRRLNVGRPGSSRALTAGTLYAGLYGTTLPAAQADARDEAAALQALLAGSIDVLVQVDAAPSRWLARLPPAVAGQLRLLKLDATHPASRGALRQFLPARLRGADDPAALPREDTPTLAMMNFLVAPSETVPARASALGRLAAGLCSQLGMLRGLGHPAWRDVQPGLQLEVGWPYEESAAQEFRRCAALPAPVTVGQRS